MIQMPPVQYFSLCSIVICTVPPDLGSFSFSSLYLNVRTTEGPRQGRGSLNCYRQRAVWSHTLPVQYQRSLAPLGRRQTNPLLRQSYVGGAGQISAT